MIHALRPVVLNPVAPVNDAVFDVDVDEYPFLSLLRAKAWLKSFTLVTFQVSMGPQIVFALSVSSIQSVLGAGGGGGGGGETERVVRISVYADDKKGQRAVL